MYYTECRHEAERPHSSLFVICFLSVFLCAAALGTLRLYGLYLEHRISETAGRIEACRESNLGMSKRYSELLSPAKIYSYAREELGMVNAEKIRTVKVDSMEIMVAQAAVYPEEEKS
ncbi:MAG: hypothetical protein PHO18_06280, partial [Synergistaceae bacterium]|nr:hypothetical protein [Synergistaceae bacterium]